MRKDELRQQLFNKKIAIHVVILVTHQELVKREKETVHEVDKSRSTRSQKTNKAAHVRKCRTFEVFIFNAIH